MDHLERAVLGLLPTGEFWEQEIQAPNSLSVAIAARLVEIIQNFTNFLQSITVERSPLTALENLGSWEILFGLTPKATDSIAVRHQAMAQKIANNYVLHWQGLTSFLLNNQKTADFVLSEQTMFFLGVGKCGEVLWTGNKAVLTTQHKALVAPVVLAQTGVV